MGMFTGFIFLCMLQAAVPQHLEQEGPRPFNGRGDSPDPVQPPVCKSEFLYLNSALCYSFYYLICAKKELLKHFKIYS